MPAFTDKPTKNTLYARKWRAEHPERDKELQKKSYEKNKEKRHETVKQRYKNDPEYREKHKSQNLKTLYGITIEQFKILDEVQNGVCAICKKPQISRRAKNLYVDHDHKTGKVRGLLCQKCNSAIGLVDENIDTLEKIISYLKNNAKIS